MVPYFGDFDEDATVYIPFNTFSSDDPSASVTITNLADADIKVHKDGSATQIVTDGATIAIDFDTITGNHLITIDTSASADYSTGSDYIVRIEGTTVDAATINAFVGIFSIENRHPATAIAAVKAETALIVADTNELQTDDVPGLIATLDAVVDTVKVDTAAILVDTAEIGTNGAGLTALATQASVNTIDSNVDAILLDTNELQTDDIPGAIAALDAVVDTVKADTAAILVDTAVIGVAGAGLTALATQASVDTIDANVDAILVDTNELQTDDIPGAIAALDAVVDTVKAETALIVADTNELQTDWADGGRLDLLLDAIPTDTTTPPKNVALNNLMFYMVDANDHITAETGLSSITAEISQDGAAFAACTNAVVEVSDGYYKINLTQAEMNADLITVRFAHANADEVGMTFTTQE